jgi:RimJ/RimL family protein N-acetyltransferase
MTDAHFAWLLGGPAPADAPRIAEGGLAPPKNVERLRCIEPGRKMAWMMVVDGEGVGIIIALGSDTRGRWEIGYRVAATREGRGYATEAVAALKVIARNQGASGLTAETLPGSGASPQVLRRNGFVCIGQSMDGTIDRWVVDS